ncbi:hypothetical protein OE88DRAFT_1729514 [Heliocybe sulcata]|uniref:Uncharacterized protein n=1 Tax=Heliocybe sulcata TaxID=5364 RepID=A0A5C3MK92_9AGAM|nr:hypothetical protein OE88DRAFT_1729514 [Heliocybe sulcata]
MTSTTQSPLRPASSENWDEDFDFPPDSPLQPGPSSPARIPIPPTPTENWDADFPSTSDTTPRRRRPPRPSPAPWPPENWDADYDYDLPPRGRRSSSPSSAEDRTITARARPPLPTPPPDAFPRSPTASLFSVPPSRESFAYGSTHALRPTLSGSSAPHHPVPRAFSGATTTAQRERRRLRKKSRPRPLDNNLIELVDIDPEEPTYPVPVPSTPDLPAPAQPELAVSSPHSRGVLSRIGSVGKRWGRRKRSAGEEGMDRERERAPPPPGMSTRTVTDPHSPGRARWFFRGGVAEGEVSEGDEEAGREGPRGRSVSTGTDTSVSVSVSASVSASVRESASGEGDVEHGFVRRMRRISLGAPVALRPRHRKTQSGVGTGLGSTASLKPRSETPSSKPRPSPPSSKPRPSPPSSNPRPSPPSLSSKARSETALPAPAKQSASLGRAAQLPVPVASGMGARRNSLGDLKGELMIPARISEAQGALRRDLELVREFAGSVDKLKQLQVTYAALVRDVQAAGVGVGREYEAVERRYRVVWECAELLVELGGAGAGAGGGGGSAPAMQVSHSAPERERERERRVTLASGWRASEGRHDLSARQMGLLREMLHTTGEGEGEGVDREWRWGVGGSTVTLPEHHHHEEGGKRRAGMSGVRDVLRMVKEGRGGRRRAKTSAEAGGWKLAPRRPSLASLFRIGRVREGEGEEEGEEEDWDEMDGMGTVKGRAHTQHKKEKEKARWGGGKSASVRSAPPLEGVAVRPADIGPLLESAREVEGRLGECVEEMRGLFEGCAWSGEGVLGGVVLAGERVGGCVSEAGRKCDWECGGAYVLKTVLRRTHSTRQVVPERRGARWLGDARPWFRCLKQRVSLPTARPERWGDDARLNRMLSEPPRSSPRARGGSSESRSLARRLSVCVRFEGQLLALKYLYIALGFGRHCELGLLRLVKLEA